jgi:hypothetical protein
MNHGIWALHSREIGLRHFTLFADCQAVERVQCPSLLRKRKASPLLRLGAVPEPRHAGMLRTGGATEDDSVLFYAVADYPTATMIARTQAKWSAYAERSEKSVGHRMT